jgi:hypothetical protein
MASRQAVNGPDHHQVAWVASGVRRAAHEAGVELEVDYARQLSADALSLDSQVGVTRLGAGVVIHTVPESNHKLPVVVGYADHAGQWYRDGRRHTTATRSDPAGSQPGLNRINTAERVVL